MVSSYPQKLIHHENNYLAYLTTIVPTTPPWPRILIFHEFSCQPKTQKLYPRNLIPSILDNDCTYHTTMATNINIPRIFLPTKNTKIIPTKFNTRTVVHSVHVILQSHQGSTHDG